MPKLELTDEQVLDLVNQLSPDSRSELIRRLVDERLTAWHRSAAGIPEKMRKVAAARGLDWDRLSEEEQLDLLEETHESE